jgi:hypothetical protein
MGTPGVPRAARCSELRRPDGQVPALVQRYLERVLPPDGDVPRQAGEMWRKSGARVRRFLKMERAGIEPATSGLQTQPIARPHLTPTDKTGMTEPNLALLSNVIRHSSTAVRSHRARTAAA